MKYNSIYFNLFKGSIKKVLIKEFNREYANKIINEAKTKYKEIVINAIDIGKYNPMAFNELFALVYIYFR